MARRAVRMVHFGAEAGRDPDVAQPDRIDREGAPKPPRPRWR